MYQTRMRLRSNSTKSNDQTRRADLEQQKREEEFEDIDQNILDKEWALEDFSFGKLLGKGRFGKVFLVKENRTKFQHILAIKILSKRMLIESKTVVNFKREYEIHYNLRKIRHPNVLGIYGYFHDERKIYIILEYAPNGNLYKKLEDGPLEQCDAATYVLQVTEALIYIHSKNIVHRDLKPENLLIGFWGEIKLADFGWSNIYESTLENAECCQSLAGTLDYLCPEMINQEPHDTKVDNWCLGVLCYEMLTGKAPFHSADNKKTMQLIQKVKYQFPGSVNVLAKNLVSKLLVKNPKERIELVKVLEDPWIQKCAIRDDLYKNLFRYN